MGLNQAINFQDFQQGFIQGPREFFIGVHKELARVERYGHKTTFLLIKPVLKNNASKESYLKNLYQCISEELRHCDSVYLLSDDTLAAILPHTHEAGGESAAHRVKKKISQIDSIENIPIPVSIGVVSVWPGECPKVNDLILELKKDLERDERCQLLPQTRGEETEKPRLCLIASESIASIILKELKGFFKISRDPETSHASDCLIAEKSQLDTIKQKVNFHQINRKLKNRIDLKFKDIELSLCFNGKADLSRIVRAIWGQDEGPTKDSHEFSGRKVKDVLSAIGSSTHQLNQPLQIMMGKIELLLLDLLTEDGVSKEMLKDSLTQIKEQVHYAAEINSKINRLSKL